MKDIKRTTSPNHSEASPRHAASVSSAPAYATMSEIDSFFRQQRQLQKAWNQEAIKSIESLHAYRSQKPLLNCNSTDSNSHRLVKDPHHPILMVSSSSENVELRSCEWDDQLGNALVSIQKVLNNQMAEATGSPRADLPRGYKSKLPAKAALLAPLSPVQDFDSRTKALSELLASAIQDPLPTSPASSILKPRNLDSPRARALQQRIAPALPDIKKISTQPSEEDLSHADSIEITLVSMPEKNYRSSRKQSINQKYQIKTSTKFEAPAIKQSAKPNASPARNKTMEKESRRSPRRDLIMKGKRHRPKPAGSIPESQEWTEEKTGDNSCKVDVSTVKTPTPTTNSTTHPESKIQRTDSTKQTRRSAADVDLAEKSNPDLIVNIAGKKAKEVEHLYPAIAEEAQNEPSSFAISEAPSDECKEKLSPEKKTPGASSILKAGCQTSNLLDPMHRTIYTNHSEDSDHLSRDSYIPIQTSHSGLESVLSIPLGEQTLEEIEPGRIKIVLSKHNERPPSASFLETGTQIPGRTTSTDIPTVNSYKSSATAHSFKSSATAHLDACLRHDFAVLSMNESDEEVLSPTSALNSLLRIDSRYECDECEEDVFDYTRALKIEPSESKDTICIDPGLVGVEPFSSSNKTPAIAVFEEEKKPVHEDVTEDEAYVFSVLNTSPQNLVDPDAHVFPILNAALETTPSQKHADPFIIVESADQKTEDISVSATMPESVNEMVEETADSCMMPESVDSYDNTYSSDNSFSIDHRSFRSAAPNAILPPAPVVVSSTPQPKDYTAPLIARAGSGTPRNVFGYTKSSPPSSETAMPRSNRKSGIVTPQARTPMKRLTAPTSSYYVRAGPSAGGKAPESARSQRSDPGAVSKRNRPKRSDPSPVAEKATRVLKQVPLYLRKPLRKKEKEKEVICCQKYDPHLHKSRAGCERCLYWASREEKEMFEENGHHHRIMMVRGGCNQGCAVFPRETDEFPVRLCVKCYYDTHKEGLNSLEWEGEVNLRFH